MVAIKTVNLTKKYKDTVAVDKLNLQIEQGTLFALLGVNGAGKTTTVKMLSCLTKPTSGDAFVDTYSVKDRAADVKQIIGVLPQETAVAPKLSVKENLEFMCGIYGFSKDKRKAKTKSWRIPETTLMTIAAVGGSLGSLLGMYFFRHKTRHPKFAIGIPLLLAIHIVLLVILVG